MSERDEKPTCCPGHALEWEQRQQLTLIDWRIGHHIEAGMGLIAGAITLLAKAQEASNAIQKRLVTLQEENISTAKIMREMADTFMRGGSASEPERPIAPPDWLKDELKGD